MLFGTIVVRAAGLALGVGAMDTTAEGDTAGLANIPMADGAAVGVAVGVGENRSDALVNFPGKRLAAACTCKCATVK